jgi:hypothetical protein
MGGGWSIVCFGKQFERGRGSLGAVMQTTLMTNERLDAGGTAGEEGAAVRYVRSGRTGACRCPGAPLICTRCAGASLVRAAWVQHRLSWDAEVGVLVWVLMARAGPAQRLNAPGRSVCQQVGGQHVSLQTRL